MQKAKNIDFCEGPFLRKIILFSIPIIASGLLQLLFTAADIAVLGQFSGDNAISAVSSTTSITGLLVNISMGLGNGASVVTEIWMYRGDDEVIGCDGGSKTVKICGAENNAVSHTDTSFRLC